MRVLFVQCLYLYIVVVVFLLVWITAFVYLQTAQIVKILNAHAESLNWIDRNTGELPESKISPFQYNVQCLVIFIDKLISKWYKNVL